MFVDPHVHLRDFYQYRKETVQHGLSVAKDSGVVAVFDMPNTDPPIFDELSVRKRLQLAKDANIPGVFYGLYIGLTADPEQVRSAVGIFRTFPNVIGMKLYAGHSVGNLGVVHPEDQEQVYATLSAEGYEGVLAVHAEKEEKMNSCLWTPHTPISHCHARPEEAEIASVADQVAYATKYNFPGKLHIAHISSPKAVDLVVEARANGLDISSGVCPHHFIYDWSQMNNEHFLISRRFCRISSVPLIIAAITSPGTKFLFLPMVEETRMLSVAPTQSRSSIFITKASWAIPLQTDRSPVSFQYI